MPEPTPPVGTGAGEGGTGGATPPVTPPATPPVTTEGDVVPASRFNGLMSEFNKTQSENDVLRRRIAELSGGSQPNTPPAQPPQPAQPVVAQLPDDVRQQLEGMQKATATVLESVRLGNLPRIKEEFPYARDEDIKGNTPEEWRASAEASHKATEAIVTRAAEEEKRKLREQFSREYGIPFDSEGGGGGGATGASAELEAAKATGDPLEYVSTLLHAK
jgi:hypothetical protein